MPGSITDADLNAALPDVTSSQTFPGLDGPVTIHRDEWGIPHIKATSEHDAFFAQGFVTAQDRMWHMDYDRRRALGRWAEWAGPSALKEDRLMRRLSLERAAKADFAATKPDAQAMVQALTDGINAFIDSTRTLPIEYKLLGETPDRWEPWHSFAVYKVRNMLMGTFDMKLWRARITNALGPERAASLFRGYPVDHLVTTPPGVEHTGARYDPYEELADSWQQLNQIGEIDNGSNAWVVSGARTESGMPLVAGDSHRGLDTPSVYYQVHMTCPDWSVSGYSVPGVPGAPHFSHTEHVGFGMTHGNADYQDLFIENFREAAGGLEYEYRGGWYPADVRTEVLNCRGHEELTIEVVVTRHGRIVAGDPRDGVGLAFSHTGTNGPTKWMDSVLDILRAGDADELEQAVKEWTEPVNNYMYCDTRGNFGYRLRGRIPIRDVANTWAPVDAASGLYEWEREIPWEELPQIRNPEIGYAVTCNQKVTTDEYPYHINHFFTNEWRARRITNRILDVPKGEMNVESMGAIHGDRISIPSTWVAERVASLSFDDARAREAQAYLANWDGEMGRDDVEPLIVAGVMSQVQWEIATHLFGGMVDGVLAGSGRGGPSHWGELVSHVWESLKDDDDEFLPDGRTWDEILSDALTGAVDELTGPLGADMSGWVWGKVHHTNPMHPLSATFPETDGALNPPQIPMGGGIDTPQAGSFSQGNKYVITGLSVNRYIHDPSDWSKSKWVSPLGASGHPGSPHYADQAPIWGEVDYVPQLWDWDEIAARAETTQELTPG